MLKPYEKHALHYNKIFSLPQFRNLVEMASQKLRSVKRVWYLLPQVIYFWLFTEYKEQAAKTKVHALYEAENLLKQEETEKLQQQLAEICKSEFIF